MNTPVVSPSVQAGGSSPAGLRAGGLFFNPAPHGQRVKTARKLGAEAGERAADKAGDEFRERALDFITRYVAAQSAPVPGETVTLAAKAAGIKPINDDRAFGPVYARAIRENRIRVAGFCARVRGNGTAGGRLYAPGSAA